MTPLPLRRALTALGAVVTLLALAGCSGPAGGPSGGSAGDSTGGGTRPGGGQPVTVFAAASLQQAFTAIARDHPELSVTFAFDGSAALVDQLAGGAPADVFASADEANLSKAQGRGLLDGPPTWFATNTLVLVVPPDNPGHVTGLDGSLTGRKLVVCAEGVPCGTAARTVAQRLGVTLHPVSEESKVTDVLGKVVSGEADAGLVYATDARSAGAKVRTLPIPGSDQVVNRYPMALVRGAAHGTAGRAFVAAVTSSQGRAVLASYGFGAG